MFQIFLTEVSRSKKKKIGLMNKYYLFLVVMNDFQIYILFTYIHTSIAATRDFLAVQLVRLMRASLLGRLGEPSHTPPNPPPLEESICKTRRWWW